MLRHRFPVRALVVCCLATLSVGAGPPRQAATPPPKPDPRQAVRTVGTRDKRVPDPRSGVRRVDGQSSWLGSDNSDPNIANLATPQHLAHHDVERHCVLRPINPAGAVWHVYAAIDRGDVAGLAARLTPDFRFASDDPAFAKVWPEGRDREEEAGFLDQLVEVTKPGPKGIQVSFGELTLDPPTQEFHAAPGRYKVIVRNAVIDLTLADGRILQVGPRTHTFEVECTALPGTSSARYPKGLAVCAVCRWDEVLGRSRSVELPAGPVSTRPPDSLATRVPNHPPDSLAVPAVLALRVISNGRRGSIALEIALPIAGDARLEMFDVAGRRVDTRELSGLTRGIHPVGIPGQLANGVYWARLHQGTSMKTARVVVLR